MADLTNGRADLRGLLDAVEAAPPVEAVRTLGRALADLVGASDVSFLIADFSGDALIRFESTLDGTSAPDGVGQPPDLTRVPLVGTPYERAIRAQDLQVVDDGDQIRLFAPVTDRGDALGVLELMLPSAPDDAARTFVSSAAHALAYVVIANRRHTDLFERGQRNTPFSLAAEIQRRLLPDAFTCEALEFTVAGWLEPADDVGGDTFDYSVDRDVLHLSISDAMGHTVNAAQLATLAVGSLRNSRRGRVGVVEQAHAASEAVLEHAQDEEFVTAMLLRVDLATGRAAVVNAGHPACYLLRAGAAGPVALDVDLPLGMLPGWDYREQLLELEPGDRLMLLTDGMFERNATTIDIVSALEESADLHPREVVHGLGRSVLGVTGGDLRDDATVLCLDWYGRNGDPAAGRVSRAGATQSRASAPAPTEG